MFGLSKKQDTWVLGALGVVAAYFVYTNLIAGPDIPAASKGGKAAQSAESTAPGVLATSQGTSTRRRGATRARSEEFHPVYLDPNPANRRDPKTIDPTLQLDRFAKVQSVELAGGSRNVFQFAAAPPPPAAALLAKNEPIVKPFVPMGPKAPAPPAPPPPPPPPPPITLKFYGYSTAKDNGKKTAYLLDGDEIFLAAEGDTLKRRYRIVRIAPNSITIEDLDAKRQQSVPITEEGAG
jgi:hypothetical protein